MGEELGCVMIGRGGTKQRHSLICNPLPNKMELSTSYARLSLVSCAL